MQETLGVDIARMVGPFRVFRTDLRRAFDEFRGALVNIYVLLTRGTTRFAAVRVRHDIRRAGSSSYTLRKLLTHSMNMLTGFGIAPLQWASTLGFGVRLLGFILFLVVVGRYLIEGVRVPGFAFLASVIIVFSGVQLVTLGIVGEYLARVHHPPDGPSSLRDPDNRGAGRRAPHEWRPQVARASADS